MNNNPRDMMVDWDIREAVTSKSKLLSDMLTVDEMQVISIRF